MSLVDLINSVVNEVQSSKNTDPITSYIHQTLPLQPAPYVLVTPVTSVTSEKANVTEETEAQNDDGDLRMSWLVLIDGKPARVAGNRKRSYIEVLRSVQARWPGYDIEVVK